VSETGKKRERKVEAVEEVTHVEEPASCGNFFDFRDGCDGSDF
jgi:hypothetical protein